MSRFIWFPILIGLGFATFSEADVSLGPIPEAATPAPKIQSIQDEKESRNAAQKKIDSQLLYALKQKRGETRGVPTEPIKLRTDEKGRPLVDITCTTTPRVASLVRKLGGVVITQEAFYHSIRASLALEKMEALAALGEVKFIAPAAQSMNNRMPDNRVPNKRVPDNHVPNNRIPDNRVPNNRVPN